MKTTQLLIIAKALRCLIDTAQRTTDLHNVYSNNDTLSMSWDEVEEVYNSLLLDILYSADMSSIVALEEIQKTARDESREIETKTVGPVWFTVSGTDTFPSDMLRYDCCHPMSDEESAKMPLEGQRSIVMQMDGSRVTVPTYDRWRSFGWFAEMHE